MDAPTPAPLPRRVHKYLPRAWWSLALLPVSFGLAFAVGEGIPALLGVEGQPVTAAWWGIAIAFIIAVAVFASPLVLTGWFCGKADAHGERAPRAPLFVGSALVAAFILVNLASGIQTLVDTR